MGPCQEKLANSHETGFESGDSLPRDLVTWIDSLKKKELQKELKGRELCTTGLKDELRERLIQSMLDERRKAVDSEADQDNQEEPVAKVVQHLESMDISMEKSCPLVAKSKRADDKKMQDVRTLDKEEKSDPMEVEVAHESKKPPPNNYPKAIGSLKHTGIENDRLAVKLSTGNVKSIGQVDNMKPAPETSQPKSPSRSPLRRMQSGVQSAFKNRMQNTVQSALRNLRPVSPKKVTEEPKRSSPKPKKEIVVLPQAFSTDETVSSNSSQSEVGITSTAAPPAPVVPIPGSARPYQTPATTGAPTGKLGGIHSDKPKAATASRMARIAEMRNKVRSLLLYCFRSLYISIVSNLLRLS